MLKKILLVSVLLMSLVLAACSKAGADTGQVSHAPGNWISFDQAIKKGAADNKHILVDLYTDWCKWCKVMDRKVYADPEIQKYLSSKYHIVKINAESDAVVANVQGRALTGRQLTRAFRVKGFPSTAFLTPKGKLIDVISGYIPGERFLPILEYLSASFYTNKKMKFADYLKNRKKK